MQPEKPSSKKSPKWGRGMSFSLDSSESKASNVFDRKPSLKSPSSLEKRSSSEEQVSQLQEELRKAKEEKSRVLEDLEELKRNKTMPSASVNLEKEVEKAKGSERKMLESLIEQTKQFEQTKMSLEEAKLEIRSLQESIKNLEGSKNCNGGKGLAKSQSDRDLAKLQDPFDLDVIRVKQEIGMVTKELRLATAAEEKSKKAMDGLALALKEVSTEANQAKERLSTSLTELERVRSEASRSRAMLKATEEKLQVAEEEAKKLKSEAEDSVATWNEKENGFINCMKTSEEEIANLRKENDKLIDSLRISREDYVKLRDILKHAVNEATVVKEALEIARTENSQLKDLLSEKENAYQSIKQEYECLKVSEAAAVDSVKELKGFLAATSNMDCPDTDYYSRSPVSEVKESRRSEKVPSDRWGGESGTHNLKRYSRGGSVTGSLYGPSVESSRQVFGSISNVSDSRIPSSLRTYDTEASDSNELNRIDRTTLHGSMRGRESSAGEKKKQKKPMLKRFGDMLRRRSFHT
ncbi:putative WEB family protein, chloroplastic isoform X1 [Iris pallida]|uniref:WEB family protein, chloroplastic isoform X1 n=1 Tax=Iris pallida TaxID=29817 RepID=A0AAX6DJG5_IRIPA|nr:putative WEB family protein, chloroplastic isoform X1 [Iris pallida]